MVACRVGGDSGLRTRGYVVSRWAVTPSDGESGWNEASAGRGANHRARKIMSINIYLWVYVSTYHRRDIGRVCRRASRHLSKVRWRGHRDRRHRRQARGRHGRGGRRRRGRDVGRRHAANQSARRGHGPSAAVGQPRGLRGDRPIEHHREDIRDLAHHGPAVHDLAHLIRRVRWWDPPATSQPRSERSCLGAEWSLSSTTPPRLADHSSGHIQHRGAAGTSTKWPDPAPQPPNRRCSRYRPCVQPLLVLRRRLSSASSVKLSVCGRTSTLILVSADRPSYVFHHQQRKR